MQEYNLQEIKKIYLFLLIFITNISFGQDRIKNYVSEKANQIKTIDPDSTNYSDLETIGNSIGDAKIVMLGEQDHGDAPTFLAKTRLIKYLHEKKGFDVLAFESDFFALNQGWDNLPKEKDAIDSFLLKNIFSIWTSCEECHQLLYDYIPSTFKNEHPLQVSGFDMQLYMNYTTKHIYKEFDSVIRGLNLPITHSANYSSKIFPLIDTFSQMVKSPPDSNFYNRREVYLDTIKTQLSKKISDNDFWMMVINNLIVENRHLKYYHELVKDRVPYYRYLNLRDSQMALNLKWLCEVKYPNEKIIVWAHNAHVSKYSGHYHNKYVNNEWSMGTIFSLDTNLSKKTYVIGFTSLYGVAGRIFTKQYKIKRAKKNSIEQWINDSYNYAFVDLKKYNSENPGNIESFRMSGSIRSAHDADKTQWSKVFDGVFYIKRMFPCTEDFSFK